MIRLKFRLALSKEAAGDDLEGAQKVLQHEDAILLLVGVGADRACVG